MTRLFVAIDLDDSLKEAITELYGLFPHDFIKAKFTAKENLHVTLKFIGEWPFNDINDVIEALNCIPSSHSPFDLELRGLGGFPNSHNPRIIWTGGKSPQMIDLAKDIDEALHRIGVRKEKREFSTHITIARVKNIFNRNGVNDIIQKNGDGLIGVQKVDSFCLKKSELTPKGPIYSDVEVFEL